MENQDQHQGLAIRNLTASSTQSESEISIYSGDLTIPTIKKSFTKIHGAFPSLPKEFYAILQERLTEHKFPDQRLIDAVNHVIDTCVYPTPAIAEFISYDRKTKLYTYTEACKITSEQGKNMSDIFEDVKIKDKKYWKLK
jgi:hypothetical protein